MLYPIKLWAQSLSITDRVYYTIQMSLGIYLSLLVMEIVVLLGVSIYGISLMFSAFKGAPYVPTSRKQIERILENAHLKKNSNFVELGSGDGRLIRYAVKNYGLWGVGVEINPLLVWWARFLAKREGIANKVSFRHTNIINYSLRQADYLYLFLMPELIEKIVPKLKQELKKGVIILSHGFKLPGYEKNLIHTEPDKSFSTFYYKV